LTFFEQYHAHPQTVKLYCYSIWYRHSPLSAPVKSGLQCSPLLTGALNGCLWRVTIPDTVIIQYDLLKMSMVVLETCRGL